MISRSQHPKTLGINTVESETGMRLTDIKSRNISIKQLAPEWGGSLKHNGTSSVYLIKFWHPGVLEDVLMWLPCLCSDFQIWLRLSDPLLSWDQCGRDQEVNTQTPSSPSWECHRSHPPLPLGSRAQCLERRLWMECQAPTHRPLFALPCAGRMQRTSRTQRGGMHKVNGAWIPK